MSFVQIIGLIGSYSRRIAWFSSKPLLYIQLRVAANGPLVVYLSLSENFETYFLLFTSNPY